jgi:hypothetical protein
MQQMIKKHWIQNKKERKWVYAALGFAAAIVFIGLWRIAHISLYALHTLQFKSSFKNIGSLARIALFIVLAYYVCLFILQKRLAERWGFLKKWVISMSRVARSLHTPVAIIAMGLIILHVVGAFLYGFRFDFNNLSGLLALFALLPVPVSGLFRYRRLDRKWHLRLGLAFAVLFLIHAFL